MKNDFFIVVVTIQALFAMGCAATPWTEHLHPIETDFREFSAVQVRVDGSEGVRRQTGYESTAAALLEEMIENLQASNKFTTVGTSVQQGKVLLASLLITDLNYVHGAARGFVGIMGGRAVLTVVMIVKDQQSGRVLGGVKVGDQSSHAQGVFSPTTGRQVTAIAEELSQILSGK